MLVLWTGSELFCICEVVVITGEDGIDNTTYDVKGRSKQMIKCLERAGIP